MFSGSTAGAVVNAVVPGCSALVDVFVNLMAAAASPAASAAAETVFFNATRSSESACRNISTGSAWGFCSVRGPTRGDTTAHTRRSRNPSGDFAINFLDYIASAPPTVPCIQQLLRNNHLGQETVGEPVDVMSTLAPQTTDLGRQGCQGVRRSSRGFPAV